MLDSIFLRRCTLYFSETVKISIHKDLLWPNQNSSLKRWHSADEKTEDLFHSSLQSCSKGHLSHFPL